MTATDWTQDDQQLLDHIQKFLLPLALPHTNLLSDAVLNVIKTGRETGSLNDIRLVRTALSELRQTFKAFVPYRDARKVDIFGSARTSPDDPDYHLAEEFAQKITQQGFMVITGAGNGIMEAGNKGSEMNMSFGVNINLPFEQRANHYIVEDPKLVSYKYFFNRKLAFVRESDATVLFPGGFGTLDEAFEVLTLIQNGRCAPRPVVLMSGPKNPYWEKWLEFVNECLLTPRYISADDLFTFSISHSAEDAVRKIVDFYRVYHSIRYVGKTVYMRLNKELPKTIFHELRSRFQSWVVDGEFNLLEPHSAPDDNKVYMDKWRLVFKFNKMDFGKIYELIGFINEQ